MPLTDPIPLKPGMPGGFALYLRHYASALHRYLLDYNIAKRLKPHARRKTRDPVEPAGGLAQ
jgi:hypothetical protein